MAFHTGAATGYGQLWLLVLATPLWQATLAASGTIRRITQRGLTDLIRTHYGRWLALSVALVLSLGLALLRVSPIQLMFSANILQAFLAPVLLLLLLVIGNSRRIMGKFRHGWLTNLGLVATILLLVAALGLLVVGWVTGR